MVAYSVVISVTLVSLGVVYGQIPGAENVTTVHFVSSCHLDVGFADTAANIVNRYGTDVSSTYTVHCAHSNLMMLCLYN